MTIRIEVTGSSLPEVADKLLALAGQFGATRVYEHTEIAAVAEDKPKAASRKTKAKLEQAPEPVTENADAPGNAVQSAEKTTDDTAADTPEATTAGTETSVAPADALDFDKDVAPVVIEAVQRTSREAVTGVLGEFGAERASEVAEGLWPELVERLKALS